MSRRRPLASSLLTAALLMAVLQMAPTASPAAPSARGARGGGDPARAELLQRAEAEMARGDGSAALDDFERAAMMRHAADAELGAIRAALQQGLYRRALAFCAHTAGEHLENTDAGALYAWLLRAGGQPVLADRVLADTLRRSPRDPVLLAVAQAFRDDPLPIARGVLLEPPHRLAPWPVMRPERIVRAEVQQRPQKAPGAGARFLGGAVLIGDGSLAVAPSELLAGSAGVRLWLRNGLGQTTRATREAAIDGTPLAAAGIALLRLAAPLPRGTLQTPDERAPFAGSPGYAVRFAATAEAAWPWLSQGFLGGAADADAGGGVGVGLRRLGFDTGGGNSAVGAAVFDAGGRLAGIAVTDAAGVVNTLWVPATAWREWEAAVVGDHPTPMPKTPILRSPEAAGVPSSPRNALVAPDSIYEAALPLALQLLAEDP